MGRGLIFDNERREHGREIARIPAAAAGRFRQVCATRRQVRHDNMAESGTRSRDHRSPLKFLSDRQTLQFTTDHTDYARCYLMQTNNSILKYIIMSPIPTVSELYHIHTPASYVDSILRAIPVSIACFRNAVRTDLSYLS
jgi:hypothetical protein